MRIRDAVLAGHLTPQSFVDSLRGAAAHPLLRGSRQLAALLESPPTPEELSDRKHVSRLAYRLESVNLLGHVLNRTRKREVTEWRVVRDPVL